MTSDLVFHSLHEIGEGSQIAREAKQWILSMTLEQDREQGEDFWAWIEAHRKEPRKDADPNATLLDTYFVVNPSSNEVVAVGSIVSDDRDVGKHNRIPGYWAGGFNVKRNYRRRGIFRIFTKNLLDRVQDQVEISGSPLRLNFFASNPISIDYLTRHAGFLRGPVVEVGDFHSIEATFFITVRPKTRQIRVSRSDFLKYISESNSRALSYHNHKETSSWAAIALYCVLIQQVLSYTQRNPQPFGLLERSVLGIFLVISFICMRIYIHVQYLLRSFWGEAIDGCYRLASECMMMNNKEWKSLDFSLPELNESARKDLTINQNRLFYYLNDYIYRIIGKFVGIRHVQRNRLVLLACWIVWLVFIFALIVIFSDVIAYNLGIGDRPYPWIQAKSSGS